MFAQNPRTHSPSRSRASAVRRHLSRGSHPCKRRSPIMGPFVNSLQSGSEVVMDNCFKGVIRPGDMPWHHSYIGNPVLTGILNLFFRTPIGDAHCGLRGFRKDAYERLDLRTTGMEFA